MKKLVIYNILIGLVTMGIIFYYVYDIIGDDYINIITLFIAILILALTSGASLKYISQIKNEKSEGELAPQIWDGIRKYNNEIPKVWGISFIASIVFVFYYILIGYPTWSFSQIGQYNEEAIAHNEFYAKKHKLIENNEEELIRMGQGVYLVNCSMCHGILADGLNGLSEDLMKWSSEEHIEYTILNGASGSGYAIPAMPANLVDTKVAKEISAYVSSTFTANKSTKHPELVQNGKQAYEQSCASCHGMDGKGVPSLAPSMTTLVSDVLDKGKKGAIGVMPAFKNFSKIEKNALNLYIYNLNQ